MSTKLSNACSQYGASLGRRDYHASDRANVSVRLSVAHVRLNSGGYDNGGAYWGVGSPLYRVAGETSDGDTVEFFMRAADRSEVKARVRDEYGYALARFYR
jgi:hypothetical protein